MKKIKKIMSILLSLGLLATQLTFVQAADTEDMYDKTVIYEEDFNNVSNETLAGWKSNFPGLTATKGQWYSGWSGTTNTLKLVEHTSADDKCIAQEHISGKDDNVFFILPGSVTDDGIKKYEISFDYCAAGNNAESFYLRTASGTAVKATNAVNMSYAQGWQNVTMILDVEKKAWSIGSYNVPNTFNVSNVFDGSDLGVRFQILSSAATGKVIKFDNFKVTKYTLKPDKYVIADSAVSFISVDDVVQTNLNAVSRKLSKITVDFDEAIDETTITDETVFVDGKADYTTTYADNKLTITINSEYLKALTDYKLTIDGIKTVSGKDVSSKEISFKTVEKISVRSLLYSEDFNNVSDSTLAGWKSNFPGLTATKGQWYSGWSGTTNTLKLVEHTSADDKCIAQEHISGKDDNVFFILPGSVANDGINKYEISFDYCAAGGGAESFYLRTASGTAVKATEAVNMSYTQGWQNVTMILDVEKKAWSIGSYNVPNTFNVSNVFDGSDLGVRFQILSSAAAGKVIKFDNVTVYGIKESSTIDIANEDVTITNKDGFVQSNLNKVDSNLDSITIDVSEELDETTVTKENVVLECEGGADYDVAYSNSQIIITADAGLKLGTDYKLSINGLKSATGKTVEDYDLEFTTSEIALKAVEIYSEDFNEVSTDTVTGWNTAYDRNAAEKGKWYSSASTTPTLVDNTSADDKCFSTSAHTNGTEDRIYFKLPGDATNGSIKKYEITFDYYAYGEWCDWFHLYNSDGVESKINMDFTKGWHAVSMTLDLEDSAWVIGKTTCVDTNVSKTINNKDLTFCIRLHGNAAAGSTIKVDNFKVSMVVEAKNLSEETLTVKACTFTDGTNTITQIPANGTVTADVDLTINQPGEYEFTAFIAAYDNDGTLQNVKLVPVATTFNDSEIEVEGLSVAVDSNTSLCQVFIWNMGNNSLMPLTNVISLKK